MGVAGGAGGVVSCVFFSQVDVLANAFTCVASWCALETSFGVLVNRVRFWTGSTNARGVPSTRHPRSPSRGQAARGLRSDVLLRVALGTELLQLPELALRHPRVVVGGADV